jgi:hypothetical protein
MNRYFKKKIKIYHLPLHPSHQGRGVLNFLANLNDGGKKFPLPLWERARVRGIF